MATDWNGLLPSAVSARVIESAIKQSVVLQLATRQPMPTGVESVPVVSVAPTADFVAVGAPKPITKVEWSSEVLKAEEIAGITSVPEVYVSDTGGSWDIEASVENEFGKAIGARLDQAVLWGERAPASYPTGGIAGMAGGPATGADAFVAVSDAMAELEGEGILPDGIASGPGIGVALRSAALEAGDYAAAPTNALFGVPVAVTAPWPSTAVDAFVGGWENLLIGIREDITFAVSREGVLRDPVSKEVIVSAFQDDQVLCRIYARFAVVVARPLAADGSGPSTPFVGAKWVGAGNGGNGNGETRQASASEPERRGPGRPRATS